MSYNWEGTGALESHQFICGYCGSFVASNQGWIGNHRVLNRQTRIYICHLCGNPTSFVPDVGQVPGVPFGNPVKEIPNPLVEQLYEEARRATSASCYTSAILCCRKLLMHIAVSLNAPEGKSFAEYVTYLNDNHYTPPNSETWVDHIRQVGNEANHEINIGKKEDAKELLIFIEMLLKFIFEFHAKMNKRLQPQPQQPKTKK